MKTIKEPITSFIAQKIGYMIWTFCEKNQLSLGRLAPHVFGMMIGAKGKRIK